MNVLSLFDGLSGGQLALNRAGIKYAKYFAAEIDKYAVAATQHNFPETIQLGDVLKVQAKDLPKIDLLIGGSPCQGFSFAGKQLNFDDPRSKLFFEFVRLLKECRPKYFMLENVKMKKEYQDVISKYLGVEPIEINSALVSAQNRKRLYWTSIPAIDQPEDKGILLKDVLEYGEVDRDKSYCIDGNYFKGGNLKQYFDKARRQLVIVDALYKSRKERVYKEKSRTLRHNCGQLDVVEERIGVAKNNKEIFLSKHSNPPCTFYETRTTEGKKARKELSKKLGRDTTPRDCKSKMYLSSPHNKANCIVTVDSFLNYIIDENYYVRKLTPIECERLQTVPDNYTLVPHPLYKGKPMSNSQRYKMLGNGFTVDVVAHIFKNIT